MDTNLTRIFAVDESLPQYAEHVEICENGIWRPRSEFRYDDGTFTDSATHWRSIQEGAFLI